MSRNTRKKWRTRKRRSRARSASTRNLDNDTKKRQRVDTDTADFLHKQNRQLKGENDRLREDNTWLDDAYRKASSEISYLAHELGVECEKSREHDRLLAEIGNLQRENADLKQRFEEANTRASEVEEKLTSLRNTLNARIEEARVVFNRLYAIMIVHENRLDALPPNSAFHAVNRKRESVTVSWSVLDKIVDRAKRAVESIRGILDDRVAHE